MERSQIAVFAVLAAVAAGVAFKVLGTSTLIDADLHDPSAGLGDRAGSESGGEGDLWSGRSGEEGRFVSRRPGGHDGEADRAGRPGSAGKADGRLTAVVPGGERRRRTLLGKAARARREALRKDATMRAGQGAPDGPAREDPELMDFLGSRSLKASREVGDPTEAGEGVALEVLTTEDSSKAVYKEGVFEPDDGGDGIKFTENAQLTFAEAGGASGEAGTITFDVEPEWAGSDATDNSLVQIRAENQWENRLQLVKNGRYLRFILSDSFGREADISVPIDEWIPGEAHSVTAAWGDGRTSLFLDGHLAGTNTYEGQFQIGPDTPLHLGSDFRNSDYGGANATIRGFTVLKDSQHP